MLLQIIPDSWLLQISSDPVDRGCGSCPSLRLGLELDLSLPGVDCYLAMFETRGNSQGPIAGGDCGAVVLCSTFHSKQFMSQE